MGDANSCYMNVAGDPTHEGSKRFESIITDKEFYNKWIYTLIPNLSINTFGDMKKPIRLYVEKNGDNQIATCRKSYTTWKNDG